MIMKIYFPINFSIPQMLTSETFYNSPGSYIVLEQIFFQILHAFEFFFLHVLIIQEFTKFYDLPWSTQWLLPIDNGLVPVLWHRGKDVYLIATAIWLGVRARVDTSKNPQLISVQCGTVVSSSRRFSCYL